MVLKVTDLSKSYIQGDGSLLTVIEELNFTLNKSEQVAIMGESGSGKTTLLNCFTGLDNYNKGAVYINDVNLAVLNDKKLSKFRNENLGFVFQFHYLLKDFNVIENVMLPCLIKGISRKKAEDMAEQIIKKLRLDHRINYYPTQLSGGEQQRVAIARALVMKPQLLVMDEPTGNLDENLAKEIMLYISSICKEANISMVIATHNKTLAGFMDKIYFLKNKRLEEVYCND